MTRGLRNSRMQKCLQPRRSSRPELLEYIDVVAALIKRTDLLAARFHLFDLECRAILNGVEDEDELVTRIAPLIKQSPYLPSSQK